MVVLFFCFCGPNESVGHALEVELHAGRNAEPGGRGRVERRRGQLRQVHVAAPLRRGDEGLACAEEEGRAAAAVDVADGNADLSRRAPSRLGIYYQKFDKN